MSTTVAASLNEEGLVSKGDGKDFVGENASLGCNLEDQDKDSDGVIMVRSEQDSEKGPVDCSSADFSAETVSAEEILANDFELSRDVGKMGLAGKDSMVYNLGVKINEEGFLAVENMDKADPTEVVDNSDLAHVEFVLVITSLGIIYEAGMSIAGQKNIFVKQDLRNFEVESKGSLNKACETVETDSPFVTPNHVAKAVDMVQGKEVSLHNPFDSLANVTGGEVEERVGFISTEKVSGYGDESVLTTHTTMVEYEHEEFCTKVLLAISPSKEEIAWWLHLLEI